MIYRPVSVRSSARPHHFRSSICSWIFFSNFAYLLLSEMSGMGLLMGKIRPFLTELLPLFILKNSFWRIIIPSHNKVVEGI